jgi:hypothetical protein
MRRRPTSCPSGSVSITGLGRNDRFFDESLQGRAEADLIGKRLRFPEALDLDFLAAESVVEALDADNADQFTDASYAGDNPIGMRLRFDGTEEDFLTTVTDYDSDTGAFTLADDIPDDVAARVTAVGADRRNRRVRLLHRRDRSARCPTRWRWVTCRYPSSPSRLRQTASG